MVIYNSRIFFCRVLPLSKKFWKITFGLDCLVESELKWKGGIWVLRGFDPISVPLSLMCRAQGTLSERRELILIDWLWSFKLSKFPSPFNVSPRPENVMRPTVIYFNHKNPLVTHNCVCVCLAQECTFPDQVDFERKPCTRGREWGGKAATPFEEKAVREGTFTLGPSQPSTLSFSWGFWECLQCFRFNRFGKQKRHKIIAKKRLLFFRVATHWGWKKNINYSPKFINIIIIHSILNRCSTRTWVTMGHGT